MKITDIQLKRIDIPLKKTFKTALRTVSVAENVIVLVQTDSGETGFGCAPPTAAITGDTVESIVAAIRGYIAPAIIGMDIENTDGIMNAIQDALPGNTSPKAACDMAVYDLVGKHYDIPLHKFLGGYRKTLETDLTISMNQPEEMKADALDALAQGFDALKLKVGLDPELDVKRVQAVREAAGEKIRLRLDANQGWTPEQAIDVINRLDSLGMNIEFIEQPVKARDFEGLKKVRDNVDTLIMADESVFSPQDAMQLLQMDAVDFLNIKLMKCGGIYNALKIAGIAESFGVECMLGCIVESKVGLAAAAQLAAAKKNITMVDLDAAILLAEDPVDGGYEKRIPFFDVTDAPGLGISGISGMKDI